MLTIYSVDLSNIDVYAIFLTATVASNATGQSADVFINYSFKLTV